MNRAICTTVSALLVAVDKWIARYRREHGSEGEQLLISRDLQDRLDISPDSMVRPDWRGIYRVLYERAIDLWQVGMTDVPPTMDDIYSGLLALKLWCRKNASAITPASKVEELSKEADLQARGLSTPDMEGADKISAISPGEPPTPGPTPAETRAWQSYAWVCQQFPQLIPQNIKKKYTEEMYDAARQSPAYCDDDGRPIAKLTFTSWKRNLRGYIAKGPRREDTRPDIRPQEIANLNNVEDRAELMGRYSREE